MFRRTLLIALCTATLGACGTPQEAVNLSKITVSQTEILKRDLERYAAAVNQTRSASAARLSELNVQGTLLSRRTDADRSAWTLAGNKRAVEMLDHLQSRGAAIEATDVYTAAAVQGEVEADLKKRFGTAKADTKALADVIAKTNEALQPNQATHVELAIAFIREVTKGTKQAEGRFGELLDLADAQAGTAVEAVSTLTGTATE